MKLYIINTLLIIHTFTSVQKIDAFCKTGLGVTNITLYALGYSSAVGMTFGTSTNIKPSRILTRLTKIKRPTAKFILVWNFRSVVVGPGPRSWKILELSIKSYIVTYKFHKWITEISFISFIKWKSRETILRKTKLGLNFFAFSILNF